MIADILGEPSDLASENDRKENAKFSFLASEPSFLPSRSFFPPSDGKGKKRLCWGRKPMGTPLCTGAEGNGRESSIQDEENKWHNHTLTAQKNKKNGDVPGAWIWERTTKAKELVAATNAIVTKEVRIEVFMMKREWIDSVQKDSNRLLAMWKIVVRRQGTEGSKR